MKLTEHEISVLTNALRVATRVYLENAVTLRNNMKDADSAADAEVYQRLAQQFMRQADEASAMLFKLEDSEG